MKKRIVVILATSLFSLCACDAKPTIKPINKTYFAFDTVASITLYQENNELFNNTNKMISLYDKLFDSYMKYSGIANVYTINHTNEPVVVSKELYDALKLANQYVSTTNGYFNPLVGNLSNAWKTSLGNGQILSESEIANYLTEMNSSSLVFNDETFEITRVGNATLDLGAFAKGYVLSMLKEGVLDDTKEYLYDLGSSSVLLGEKPNGEKFNVGIKYLNNSYLNLTNTSIGTSAVYEQLYTINETKYSHIVNPFTGGVTTNYDFVMVVNPDPTLTDVLSTSLMSMDIETIKQFESTMNVEVLVSKNKSIIYQSNTLEVKHH